MKEASARPRQRVLLAILVYNGPEVVPRCLRSASALVAPSSHDVDVVVLDDASPEPGWSDELRALCQELRIRYYRSPRNLGIPRNMNLGLLRATSDGYDHVIIANSDVVFPGGLVDGLVAVADSGERIGSVTAWSNNVSIYSLLNAEPSEDLRQQESLDWISTTLEAHFGNRGVGIPVGVGFCLLIPTPVIGDVGLFDPVFGRGYCEEVDWCLRAGELGFRNMLAPSVFVFHEGGASARGAGLLHGGDTTVRAHEQIIDLRYPGFRGIVENFCRSDALPHLAKEATRAIVTAGARDFGYVIDATWLQRTSDGPERVSFVVEPDGRPVLTGHFLGFTAELPLNGRGVTATVAEAVGAPPARVRVFDRGHLARRLADEAEAAGITVLDRRGYPERV